MARSSYSDIGGGAPIGAGLSSGYIAPAPYGPYPSQAGTGQPTSPDFAELQAMIAQAQQQAATTRRAPLPSGMQGGPPPLPALSAASGGGGGGGMPQYIYPSATGGGGNTDLPAGLGSPDSVNAPMWQTPTGWAARYTPNIISNIAQVHPEVLAGDVLSKMGLGNNPLLATQLGSNGQFANLAAYLTSGGKALTDSDVLNFMGNLFQQESTVGGKSLNPQYLVNAVLTAADNPNSPLGAYLFAAANPNNPAKGGGNSLEQTTQLINAAILNTLNDVNPYAQKGMQSYLNQMQTQYTAALAKGQNPGTYSQYLQAHGVGNFFGGPGGGASPTT